MKPSTHIKTHQEVLEGHAYQDAWGNFVVPLETAQRIVKEAVILSVTDAVNEVLA